MAGTSQQTAKKSNKKHNGSPKPKITKEERRAKYTNLARERDARKRRQQVSSTLVCFQCRERGHAIADCPQNKGTTKTKKQKKNETEQSTAAATVRICYKCGSTEHPLSQCPKRNQGDSDDLPFCLCFICKEKGHLSSKCPKNDHGIFVNGGECKQCGSKLHKSKNCPEKKESAKKEEKFVSGEADVDPDTLLEGEGDEQADIQQAKTTITTNEKDATNDSHQKKKRRVVNF